ncbi:hypothetical protein QM588_22320 [Rhodococcus sp. IEGM 1354]|uniref:hypothetical protein n=1 Tax=Rhodococcus sp. IEGM 1354 TaxID=3047088 RepID=UPI0024B686F9|nr:hypothetical protein [Rhodococcus sp. IEGM 1354]MDI9933163.1 hypothetical protein [Rhodococcus sp. IEGM 1354]
MSSTESADQTDKAKTDKADQNTTKKEPPDTGWVKKEGIYKNHEPDEITRFEK